MKAFRTWAQTPPKGWNSWDCFGAAVTEEDVRQNAAYMAEHLLDYGWEYVVVDIQWYEPNADSSVYHPFTDLEMDEYSRLIPAVNRFPSAKEGAGFKELGEYIHSLGLKFGIHIMRGIPRQAVHQNTPIKNSTYTARDIAKPNSISPWNTDMYGVDTSKPGAKEYYASLIELYASWGVDFLKIDDIADSKLYGGHIDEIALIREVIDESGREIVLSLSPGPASLEHGSFLHNHANMWRLTDDYWDNWWQLYEMFEKSAKWSPFVRPGNWPDCDMLPLGHIGVRSLDGGGGDRMTRFTKAEQKSMMSLWSIFKSPLMFGGHLPDNDDWTLSLLQNKDLQELIELGHGGYEVSRTDDIVIWYSKTEAHEWIAVFNLNDETRNVELNTNDLLEYPAKQLEEIWSKNQIAVQDTTKLMIEPHDVKLFKTI
ncbi:glycoside hydrolase family 27 protein [Marinilactibacillus kalidii]|uniref:glycoside hydrolase family 27 protein n=1 Tax=Marinilactibacillus kalidii TaxID=2820274 RepID=UPI001ABE86EE|nr:glycoside hydrolase family 27 protein [Marinilactibacillus kalidii]